MISQHIECEPQNDDYARLANYIADASHKGEKCLFSWCAGTWAGDDEYGLSITEVLDTQALNTRTTREKTYHLLISFRPEDEAKLTPEIFKDIESRFADALGFSDHQRHCGVHQNTANLHMHVAYNMIHPERLSRHEPWQDYKVRDRLCRELEREYGLTVDNGREVAGQNLGVGAAKIESVTGQQSFEGYAKSKAGELMPVVAAAQTWQAVHDALAGYGLSIRPHGNGLVVGNVHGKEAIKASAVSRDLTFKKLIARLGTFTPPREQGQAQEKDRYRRTPLQRDPNRDNLYAEYKAVYEVKKAALDDLRTAKDREEAEIKKRWESKRRSLFGAMLKRLASNREKTELVQTRQKYAAERQRIHAATPGNWTAFLRIRAAEGNETALAILRSKKEVVQPENEAATPYKEKDWGREGAYLLQERRILELTGVTDRTKKQLLNVLKMQRIMADVKYEVDHMGVIIFQTPEGGMIRDDGRKIFYSPKAQEAARAYAKIRWGRNQVEEGNQIKFIKRNVQQQKERELER